METYKDGDTTLAIVFRDKDWAPGLNFPTPDSFFLQAGCWQYEKGKKLRNHIHKDYERVAIRTQECVYVRRGKLRVFLFDEGKKPFGQFDLDTGDFAVMAYGGHGYEILVEGTQVIETKNGPFVSVEKDKEIIA